MNVFVLDETKNTVAIVDNYISLIWTERYSVYGDFELYTLADDSMLNFLRKNRYLRIPESDRIMVIEDIYLDTDVENGNYLTVSGRSVESILDRRIIWGQKVVNGNLQDAVYSLLNENLINPSDPDRKIDGFIFEYSVDEAITGLNVSAQFAGDNLYDAVQALCEAFGIGFKVTMNSSNQFVFKLYAGKDRSYNQNENAYVIFSPTFDNIISSNYAESDRTYKNVALVAGEGEGSDRKLVTVGSGSGLSRRELFTDAKTVSSKTKDGTLSAKEYTAQLEQSGANDLAKNLPVVSFEANVDPTGLFRYGEHFFIGDIVQTANEYGIEGIARITELIRSQSDNGFEVYPTFIMLR